MGSNKYLIQDKSKLLKTKLEVITKKLQGSVESENLQTQEQYIFEAIKSLQTFYKDMQEPLLGTDDIANIKQDDLPNPELYNKIWEEVLDDLTIIFTELENIENLTISNFNFITTESNRLTARLKTVSSLLGDFILYSLNPNKDSTYFKDSYNDLSKVDIKSALLNEEECDINQTEGVVTLPIDQEKDSSIAITETPIINPNSNGTPGNNQQIGAKHNGNLSLLIDNNPDTWFEFERVLNLVSEDLNPLVLDLTINLGKPTVINHIRINPNNFGTKTVIQIEKIDTSTDGVVYTSIKDDIPIADFTEEDEENIFTLAPSTSKFAGQGIYTFTPRKVKYVKFTFKQSEAYVITTSVGERLRYAIGIRDIEIRNIVFKNKGEIISTLFETTDEIRKVLIESNQNPKETSELASIKWYISPDNGSSWNEIQPKEFTPDSGIVSVPEILEFNGSSAGTINTSSPVNSLRVKALLERNNDQFTEGNSSLNKSIVNTAEAHVVPTSSPFSIGLNNSPVIGSISVIDPLFGSRGKPESGYILGHATDRLDTKKFRLPFVNLPRPVKKVSSGSNPVKWNLKQMQASEWFHLEVGGEEWTQATKPLNQYSNLTGTHRLYHFDIARGIIEFGNGENTLAPPDNAPITVYFESERLFPNELDDVHLSNLDFHTSNNKNDFTIKRYDEIKDATEVLARKASVIRLRNQNITTRGTIDQLFNNWHINVDSSFSGTTEVVFLNGQDEFLDPDLTPGFFFWSMDDENGVIYTSSPSPDDTDLSVSYKYQPIYILKKEDWDWDTTKVLRDSVSIKESAWLTKNITEEELPTTLNIKIIDLSKLSVEKGSLQLSIEGTTTTNSSGGAIPDDDPQNPFQKEVDFINGTSELGGAISQATEAILKNLTSTSSGIASFQLKENISSDLAKSVLFSKSGSFDLANNIVFSSLKTFVDGSSELLNLGDYSIDRTPASGTYGTVYVRLSASGIAIAVNPGNVTYFYTSPNFSPSGLYSVDYKHGRIHTQLPLDPNNEGDWSLKATYEWTDFKAEYRIARLVDKENYDVDIVENTISFKDSEILKYSDIPHATMLPREPSYLVNYDYVDTNRESIEDLKNSFTPVIKDYALRVLTKGNIF